MKSAGNNFAETSSMYSPLSVLSFSGVACGSITLLRRRPVPFPLPVDPADPRGFPFAIFVIPLPLLFPNNACPPFPDLCPECRCIRANHCCSLSECTIKYSFARCVRLRRASSLSKKPTTASSTNERKMKPMQPNIQMSNAFT